jgi:hypothetical protein
MRDVQAGPELDALVAEKAMGWRDIAMDTGGIWANQLVGYVHGRAQPVPPWSMDIAAAWLVVERFYSARIERLSDGEVYEAYLVTERDGANADGFARAPTAPLAICRAALAALGGDD